MTTAAAARRGCVRLDRHAGAPLAAALVLLLLLWFACTVQLPRPPPPPPWDPSINAAYSTPTRQLDADPTFSPTARPTHPPIRSISSRTRFRPDRIGHDALGAYRVTGGERWLRGPWASPLLSLVHRLVVCPIPKTGSTSWRRLLTRLSGDGNWTLPYPDIHHFATHHIPHLRDLPTTAEVEDVLRSPDVRKLVVVRHPHVRLLSAYLDKVVVEKYDETEFGIQGMSFALFVRALQDQYTCRDTIPDNGWVVAMNEHWMPQHCLCALPHLDFEIVHMNESRLAVESLVATGHVPRSMVENGFGTALNQSMFNVQLGRPSAGNVGDHAASAVAAAAAAANAQRSEARLQQFYTPELLELVRVLYAEDFSAFGFDPHQYDHLVASVT